MDLRNEFASLIKTELGGVGRWIAVRHFTDEHSEFWKESTSEAVGGPAFLFSDALTESYSAPALSRTALRNEGVIIEEPASMDTDFIRFFIENDVLIEKDDEIFDLDYYSTIQPTFVYNSSEEDFATNKVCAKERYKVKKIGKYRCDQGRIEFKVAYAYKTIQR